MLVLMFTSFPPGTETLKQRRVNMPLRICKYAPFQKLLTRDSISRWHDRRVGNFKSAEPTVLPLFHGDMQAAAWASIDVDLILCALQAKEVWVTVTWLSCCSVWKVNREIMSPWHRPDRGFKVNPWSSSLDPYIYVWNKDFFTGYGEIPAVSQLEY